MLGQPVAQTFAYDGSTEFLKWSSGVPSVVTAGDLQAGDYVRVNVKAPRGSSLATIEGTSAGTVGDLGTSITPPDKPEYLFRGKVLSVGAGVIRLNVKSGNERASRLLIGKSSTQPFQVNASTIYLSWQGNVPTVIALSDVKKGDSIAIHVRADKGSTLRQVEAAGATKVAEHEPASTTT